jgi:hypothetical protein
MRILMLRVLNPCASNRIKLVIKFPFDLSGQSGPSLAPVIKRLTTLTFYWGEWGRTMSMPILHQKLRVMGLVGGPGATTLTTWRRWTRVSCHSYQNFD